MRVEVLWRERRANTAESRYFQMVVELGHSAQRPRPAVSTVDNRDWDDVINRYNGVVLYLDPPYLDANQYRDGEAFDHAALAVWLRRNQRGVAGVAPNPAAANQARRQGGRRTQKVAILRLPTVSVLSG